MNYRSFSSRSFSLEIGLIIGLFFVVLTLDISTPVDYLIGYLYTAPILLTSFRFGRSATLFATAIAVILILSNLWIPGGQVITLAMVVNRSIASAAIIVTGWLSENNHSYREAIARQQSQLDVQNQLVGLREDFASTLTHDLKTPLLGGIAALDAFQNENFGTINQMQKQVLTMMSCSHHTSLQLVETLLDVYHNDIEGLQLSLGPVELSALAEEVVTHLSPLAAADRIYLSLTALPSVTRYSLAAESFTMRGLNSKKCTS